MSAFIVLEGLDGSGKTTQAERLKEALAPEFPAALLTTEPSNGPIGVLLRAALRGRPALEEPELALLFAADRLQHLRAEILPVLTGGGLVISDRYYLSSLAYQTLSHKLDREWLWQINRLATRPDLTVFLSVPPEVCVARLAARSASGGWPERYDALAHQQAIEQNYRRAIEFLVERGERIVQVDGTQPPEVVGENILQEVRSVRLRRTRTATSRRRR